MGRKGIVCLFIGLMVVAGCSSMGPPTIAKDRFDYNSAVANSWKEQTLLNIVRFRYLDPPVFLEVSQIISGYTFEGALKAESTLSSPEAVQGDFFAIGGSGKYTDRPTITYSPMTGIQFLKNLVVPIDPANIFLLIQAGWPAEKLLPLTVQSINGIRNRSGGLATTHTGDPEFFQVVELLGRIQKSGLVGMQVKKEKQPHETTITFFSAGNISPEMLKAGQDLKRILDLKSDSKEFRLVFGGMQQRQDEIAMLTRSMAQILIDLASYVEIPKIHEIEKRAAPGISMQKDQPEQKEMPFRVYSGKERSPYAVVAVRYRDFWYWIDDRDLYTKRTFSFISFLFAFADVGVNREVPLVTVPAG